ncbi:MAG TPA: response regulator [Polyangiaceae bacterium]|nr:response regulator [Polyangiaceae bacterium]
MSSSLTPEPNDPGRVVVVDDSWTILEQIRLCLAERGYDVRTTTSPDVAVRLLRGADLTIIDFHMPGINGTELVQMLRSAQTVESTCLFYLYTSDRDEAARYLTHGFDGAFLKKGDEAALVPQVEAVFRTVRMRRLTQKIRKNRVDSAL